MHVAGAAARLAVHRQCRTRTSTVTFIASGGPAVMAGALLLGPIVCRFERDVVLATSDQDGRPSAVRS